MPRTLFGLLPVVTVLLFTLLMPGKAVAELPEGEQGQMVVDEVCEGLRQYRRETDSVMRSKLLTKLAPTRDPRVAVVLGVVIKVDMMVRIRTKPLAETRIAWDLLERYYLPPEEGKPTVGKTLLWWENNEADLRRRAKQLPQ